MGDVMVGGRSQVWWYLSVVLMGFGHVFASSGVDFVPVGVSGAAGTDTLSSTLVELSLTDKVHKIVDHFHKAGLFNGTVIVSPDGHEVVLRSYGYSDGESRTSFMWNTKFRIGSVSKQFTAFAIMQLCLSGRVELNADIKKYLPDFHVEGVTIHKLLTHTHGLPEYFEDKAAIVATTEFLENLRARAIAMETSVAAGFKYGSSGYGILAKIIEIAGGKPFAEYMRENVFEPLKMFDTGCLTEGIPDELAQGYVRGETGLEAVAPIDALTVTGTGSLYSTAADLFRWLKFVELPDLFVDVMESHSPIILGRMRSRFFGRSHVVAPLHHAVGSSDNSYGYGWYFSEIAGRVHAQHFGKVRGYRCGVFRLPATTTLIVILSNFEDAQVEQLKNVLVSALFNESYILPPLPVAGADAPVVNKALLMRYSGAYRAREGGGTITISCDEGEILYTLRSGSSSGRKPMKSVNGRDVFLLEAVQATYQFVMAGDTLSICVEQRGEKVFYDKVSD